MQDVLYTTKIAYNQAPAGKEFAFVPVGIKYFGKNQGHFNLFDFKLEGGQGARRSPTFVVGLDGDLGSGDLAPNGSASGMLPFEITKGDRNLKLICSPCLLLCSDITVPLH